MYHDSSMSMRIQMIWMNKCIYKYIYFFLYCRSHLVTFSAIFEFTYIERRGSVSIRGNDWVEWCRDTDNLEIINNWRSILQNSQAQITQTFSISWHWIDHSPKAIYWWQHWLVRGEDFQLRAKRHHSRIFLRIRILWISVYVGK